MKHTYAWKDGKLQHLIDGDLRAVVEPKNVAAYAESAGLDPATIPPEGSSGFTWVRGKLEHRVDGVLRATIEPQDVDVYLKSAGIDPATVPHSPGADSVEKAQHKAKAALV